MKHSLSYLFLMGLFVLVLSACRSSKHVASESGSEAISVITSTSESKKATQQIVSRLNAKRMDKNCLTAKLSVTLSANSKTTSVGGTLRMKRDDVIQISLVALGIIEAGRLELTKDYLLVVDRLGHEYVRVKYSQVPFLQKAGIDFYTFQSLFWNELFLLGDKGEAPKDKDYEKDIVSQGVQLQNEDSEYMLLSFLVDAVKTHLSQTTIQGRTDSTRSLSLDWKYPSFDKDFPSCMQISLNSGRKPFQLELGLSNLSHDSDWQTRTEVSKKYEEIPLENVLKKIVSLAN